MAAILDVIEVEQFFRAGFWLKQVKVLKGVSLSVPSRSIFGFLGPNGAGKTTLIHLMIGLKKPSRGRVLISGVDSSSLFARSKMGYLPERPYFHEHLTGEGLLKYYGTLSGMKRLQILSRIPKVLSAVGLTAARRLELKKYSKGMLQRIGIAQALIHQPELLILDEPMSGLDPLGRKEIRELIVSLAGEGHTVFFSSHVIPDVEAICDQVAWIQKGELMGCGSVEGFLSKGGPLRTEIEFTGVSRSQISHWSEFTSIRENPTGMQGLVEGQERVNLILTRLLQEGAQILSAIPIRPSLEDLFKK